jgi:hypothetical protein
MHHGGHQDALARAVGEDRWQRQRADLGQLVESQLQRRVEFLLPIRPAS